MPITTNIVSLNHIHGKVYSIQHYVIKFVSDFLWSGYSVSSTNKTYLHDIIEILLKVLLNTLTVLFCNKIISFDTPYCFCGLAII